MDEEDTGGGNPPNQARPVIREEILPRPGIRSTRPDETTQVSNAHGLEDRPSSVNIDSNQQTPTTTDVNPRSPSPEIGTEPENRPTSTTMATRNRPSSKIKLPQTTIDFSLDDDDAQDNFMDWLNQIDEGNNKINKDVEGCKLPSTFKGLDEMVDDDEDDVPIPPSSLEGLDTLGDMESDAGNASSLAELERADHVYKSSKKGHSSDRPKGQSSDRTRGHSSDQPRGQSSDQTRGHSSDQPSGQSSDQLRDHSSDQSRDQSSDELSNTSLNQA